LYSFDVLLELNNVYSLKINASRNYRIPTFNDLYWHAGGNSNLQPETSYQGELGNIFRFGKLQIDVTAYYIDSKNLIQWRPNDRGVWSPENISEAKNYGLESTMQYHNSFGKNRISLHANYAYTKAINSEKKKQQLYVPFHKATALIRYGYENFSLYSQVIYNGRVFSTTDNLGVVDAYSIANLGLELEVLKKTLPITFGIKANNIFNTYYENVAYRPMPDRNFETYLNLKF
jgi:iron complex outermembrane receptor protein